MKHKTTMLLALAALSPTMTPSVQAQSLTTQQINAQPVLLAGAPVRLRFAETVTTKKNAIWEGRRFRLQVQEAVVSNGITVIPAGSIATGEVSYFRKKGSWGRSGYVGIRLISVNNGQRTIRISGSAGDKGIIGTAGVIAALATVPVLGFVFTGTSGTIHEGTSITGYTDEDIPVIDTNKEMASVEGLSRQLYDYDHSKVIPRSLPAVRGVDD